MSLREQAAADVAAQIEADNESVTLTPPPGQGDPFDAPAQIIRRNSRINPSTGEVISDDATWITVPILSLPLDEFGQPRRPAEGWRFDCVDVTGRELSFVIDAAPREDSTLGFLTFHGVGIDDETSD